MAGKLFTEYGNVTIDEEVIARISGITAMECYGVVGMAARNVKDGLVQLLMLDSLTKGIAVEVNENKLSLSFHIIVEYGVKISAVADNLISTVKYKVKEQVGLEVEKINIFIEGVRVDR
ncbi:MAG TPA: Asp23/Gls24 family envelope stress response protein [Epulopiscium sp.]|nr:Asp23/Gls24 family envelope stress response protein [Candidatus Epulonipiscium sp.]